MSKLQFYDTHVIFFRALRKIRINLRLVLSGLLVEWSSAYNLSSPRTSPTRCVIVADGTVVRLRGPMLTNTQIALSREAWQHPRVFINRSRDPTCCLHEISRYSSERKSIDAGVWEGISIERKTLPDECR